MPLPEIEPAKLQGLFIGILSQEDVEGMRCRSISIHRSCALRQEIDHLLAAFDALKNALEVVTRLNLDANTRWC